MKTDFGKYIDVPFVHRGRSFDGCDCYGLIRLIYKEELSIELPDFLEIEYNCDLNEEDETHLEDHWENGISKGQWKPVKPPYKKWDGLLFYASSRRVIADHIGLYIGDGKFIHTSLHYKMSMVGKLEGMWEKKLYGGARFIGKS